MSLSGKLEKFRGSLRKHLDDMFGEPFVNLAMARNGLTHAGGRVQIPVVLRAVPDQPAAEGLDGPEQVGPFHRSYGHVFMGLHKRNVPAFNLGEDVPQVLPQLVQRLALGHELRVGLQVAEPPAVGLLPVDDLDCAHDTTPSSDSNLILEINASAGKFQPHIQPPPPAPCSHTATILGVTTDVSGAARAHIMCRCGLLIASRELSTFPTLAERAALSSGRMKRCLAARSSRSVQ
jgi:hypothetical protein